MHKTIIYSSALLLVLFSPGCLAYVGPGLGAGTIGVILGLLLSVFVALTAILWYPLKRMIKKFRKNKMTGSDE